MSILDQLIARYPSLGVCREDISKASTMIIDCFQGGGKLLVCGNGGSGADAQHIVGELVKSFSLSRPLEKSLVSELARRFGEEGKELASGLEQGLPAICLGANFALTTAVVNDLEPSVLFAQEVVALGRPGDLLLALSTSGTSPNVLKAIMVADGMGLSTLALTRDSGGKMKGLAEHTITVPANSNFEVQELHLPIYHALCRMVEERFFGE